MANNSLSKIVFILAYIFNEQYLKKFNGIMGSNIIKQLYSEEEINNIKSYFEQLNKIQNNKILNNENNNLNGLINSFYNIYREQLNDFNKKIQNIIFSRKKNINDNNIIIILIFLMMQCLINFIIFLKKKIFI